MGGCSAECLIYAITIVEMGTLIGSSLQIMDTGKFSMFPQLVGD